MEKRSAGAPSHGAAPPVPVIRPGYGPAPAPPDPAALGLSPARADILDRLVDSGPTGLNVGRTARQTGLHENTVREHLDALVEGHLAERTREPAHGRGRPAWRYTLHPDATTPAHPASEYATMAGALATHIARTTTDPAQQGLRAGEQWGRDLAARFSQDLAAQCSQNTAGHGAQDVTGGRRHLLDLLDSLGFAPRERAGDDTVRLTRCPLLAVARQQPAVVCAMHLGLARSVLAGHGVPPDCVTMVPFAEPGACHLIITRTSTRPAPPASPG